MTDAYELVTPRTTAGPTATARRHDRRVPVAWNLARVVGLAVVCFTVIYLGSDILEVAQPRVKLHHAGQGRRTHRANLSALQLPA